MFDLEQAIAEWRRQMAAGGIKTSDVLNELESHLRDDVAERMGAGLEASVAFEAAVRRLGEPGLLRAEFEKTGATAVRRLETLAFVGGGVLYLALASIGLLKQDLSAAERVMGSGALACAVLVSLGLRHAARRLRIGGRARQGLAVASGILGAVWMTYFILFLLQDLNLMPGALLVALLWGMNPAIAVAAFAWGLEESADSPANFGRT
jgi:hypothetical protein